MIVYGDPHRRATLAELVGEFEEALSALGPLPDALDAARWALIAAGMLEQAVLDGPATSGAQREYSRALTDAASRWFLDAYLSRSALVPARVSAAASALAGVADGPGGELVVKRPEGYAFYALYPERYVASARAWLAARGRDVGNGDGDGGEVAVCGVRSIGTGLAAVVAAVVADAGWTARRLTVRPTGPPYERAVDLEGARVAPRGWAVVVDEGPGLSGSSMAAAAMALRARGVAAERVALLPGHGGAPGGAMPESARAVWASSERHVAPDDAALWDGRAVTAALRERSERWLGEAATLTELGGGSWRRVVHGDGPGERAAWPPADTAFERPKYLCRGAVTGRALLWKFTGLDRPPGGEWAVGSDGAPAAPGPLLGFAARRWIDGRPAGAADREAAGVIDAVATRIACAARPALGDDLAAAALGRSSEMLRVNAAELLAGELVQAGVDRLIAGAGDGWAGMPSYGDGRMMPCKWMRVAAGAGAAARWVKLDADGASDHVFDHTAVGPQPLFWDIAGAALEWRLERAAADQLARAVARQVGGAAGEALWRGWHGGAGAFYRAAYAAFRAGMAQWELWRLPPDSADGRAGLQRALESHRAALRELVAARGGAAAASAGYENETRRASRTTRTQPRDSELTL